MQVTTPAPTEVSLHDTDRPADRWRALAALVGLGLLGIAGGLPLNLRLLAEPAPDEPLRRAGVMTVLAWHLARVTRQPFGRVPAWLVWASILGAACGGPGGSAAVVRPDRRRDRAAAPAAT